MEFHVYIYIYIYTYIVSNIDIKKKYIYNHSTTFSASCSGSSGSGSTSPVGGAPGRLGRGAADWIGRDAAAATATAAAVDDYKYICIYVI